MTSLPLSTEKKLGLVIDLDTCVGCQACVTSCKEWNTGGQMAPLTDINPYAGDADGVWFNRVHTYEHSCGAGSRTRAFPALLPALRRAGLRDRLPDRRVLQARPPTASCWSTRTSASAASSAAGPAPMARANSTPTWA